MKKFTLVAFVFLTVLSLGVYNTGSAQVLLDENFDYPSGDNITSHGWAAHSGVGTTPITVNGTGLTFPGYVDSGIGLAALVDGTGEDDNRGFTTQTSGNVYAAFMINVTTASTAYFFHFGLNPITTSFRAKVFTNSTNHFGISFTNNTGTYAASTFTPGTTYLLVAKYQIVPGTNNDIVSLYVFDNAAPLTEPVVPTVGPITEPTQLDINPGTVAMRQTSGGLNCVIDGIRVGTSWSDLFPAPPAPVPTLGQWGLIILGFFLLGAGTLAILRRNG